MDPGENVLSTGQTGQYLHLSQSEPIHQKLQHKKHNTTQYKHSKNSSPFQPCYAKPSSSRSVSSQPSPWAQPSRRPNPQTRDPSRSGSVRMRTSFAVLEVAHVIIFEYRTQVVGWKPRGLSWGDFKLVFKLGGVETFRCDGIVCSGYLLSCI